MTYARADRELIHGERLAASDPERVWGWSGVAGSRRAARRAEIIAAGARLGPGMRVLELGCGTGLFTAMFAQCGAEIIALDISKPLIDIARRRPLPGNRVQFVCASFEDAALHGSFDAVIGSSVLHHLDVRRAIRRIWTLLIPGGVMSFAEPNMLNPQICLQKNIPFLKSWCGDSPDETAFVRWTLKRELDAGGFVDVVVTPFDWLHPRTPAHWVRHVEGIGRTLEGLPLIRDFAGSLHVRATKH